MPSVISFSLTSIRSWTGEMTCNGRVMCCKCGGIWCNWARTIVCCSTWGGGWTWACCITSGLNCCCCTVFREMLVITDTSDEGQSVVSVKHCSMVEGVVLAAPEALGLGLLWSRLAVLLLEEAFRELLLEPLLVFNLKQDLFSTKVSFSKWKSENFGEIAQKFSF